MTSRGNRYPTGADDNADFEPDTQTVSCVPSTLNATAPLTILKELKMPIKALAKNL